MASWRCAVSVGSRARLLAAATITAIVCEPDAAPGLWPSCTVYGYANDLAAINRAPVDVRVEVERRRALRGRGRQRTFPPIYLVVNEYQDIGRTGGWAAARPLRQTVHQFPALHVMISQRRQQRCMCSDCYG